MILIFILIFNELKFYSEYVLYFLLKTFYLIIKFLDKSFIFFN